jgi:hypothetical protein
MPTDNGYREPVLPFELSAGEARRGAFAVRMDWAPYQLEMDKWRQAWRTALETEPLIINSRGELQAAFDWSRYLPDEDLDRNSF